MAKPEFDFELTTTGNTPRLETKRAKTKLVILIRHNCTLDGAKER